MTTDTERLEFVTGWNYNVQHNPDKTKWAVWDVSDGLVMLGKGETMREAVDQAMDSVARGVTI